jgi:predicted NBD/HSP70 family sugar kinase
VRVDRRRFGALAIDIGVDELAVAIVALDGRVVRMQRIVRERNRRQLDDVLADIVLLCGRLGCTDTVVDDRRILAVGVGVPGLIRRGDHVIAVAPNLHWRELDLGPLLCAALGIQLPVVVGNDADLGALSESAFGVGAGAGQMVFVSGEVGVGGSVIIDGSRLSGRSGFAGEFGHLPVNPSGMRCECGTIGCWETEVGERALLRRAGLDVEGGVAAVEHLLERAEAFEPAALAALAEEGRWLGIGIAGLINVFDPDVVVLGALFARIFPLVRDALEGEVGRRMIHGLDRSVPIVGASFGADAVLIGAAELALGPVVADPAGLLGA